MQFKPYPEYKDSGVEWLGEVPAHWGVARLKYYAESNPSVVKTKLDANENIEFIPMSNIDEIIGIVEKFDYRKLEEVSVGYTSFNNGDVIFAKITPCMENGNCALVDGMNFGFGYGSTEFIVFRAKSNFGKEFLYHFLRREDLRKIAASFMTGTAGQQRISTKFLDDFPATNPSEADQKSIVSFLNDETAKIDNLISQQEKLIELLEEQRKSVITHAVTKGLDPDAPMKDSGVEWLGEVPAHWDVKALKYLGKAFIGLTYSPEEVCDENDDGAILVLRSSNIQSGSIVFFDNVFVSKDIKEDLIIKDLDILICSRNGSKNLIGKNAIIKNESRVMTFGAFTTVFRSKYQKYLYWMLNSKIFEAQSGIYLTSTINQLTVGALESMVVTFPKAEEQLKITLYLDEEIAKIDQAISKQRDLIGKLKEYRSSIISHAVTGKIDVRDMAA